MFNWIIGFLKRNLAAGLVAIIPIGLTVWVVSALWNAIDTPLRAVFLPPGPNERGFVHAIARFLNWVFGDLSFMARPGVGIAFLITLVLLIGFLARTLIGKYLVKIGDAIIGRIPFVKIIYLATKQLLSAFLGGTESVFSEVVLVEYPKKNSYAVGFLASRAKGELATINMEPILNVFVPTTPNPTSGFLLLVPESRVKRLHMSVQDAVRLIISGGIAADPNKADAVSTIFETPTTMIPVGRPSEGVHPDIRKLTEAIATDFEKARKKNDSGKNKDTEETHTLIFSDDDDE